MEREVNEKFNFKGRTLLVVESNYCESCFFYRFDSCRKYFDLIDIVGSCTQRNDGKKVIFKDITS